MHAEKIYVLPVLGIYLNLHKVFAIKLLLW